jgi:hypothetical protein
MPRRCRSRFIHNTPRSIPAASRLCQSSQRQARQARTRKFSNVVPHADPQPPPQQDNKRIPRQRPENAPEIFLCSRDGPHHANLRNPTQSANSSANPMAISLSSAASFRAKAFFRFRSFVLAKQTLSSSVSAFPQALKEKRPEFYLSLFKLLFLGRLFQPQVRARPACRASRRKSGACTSTVRHISYRRERMRAPILSASESSFTATRCPPGNLAPLSGVAISST